MTFTDIRNRILNRKLATVERIIDTGATVLLCDGRLGILDTVADAYGDGVQRGYVVGLRNEFAAWVREGEISFYKNVELAQAA